MRIAAMAYHANAEQVYERAWIDQCVSSMSEQTDKDFDLYEMNYGCSREFYFPSARHMVANFPSFVHTMNYMLDGLLLKRGYDAVLNINIDDYYAPERVAKQRAALEDGADIVSSNFIGIGVQGEVWLATQFHELDVVTEIKRGHNVIAHGVVAYSKKFWMTSSHYRPNEVPYEDLMLWQREIERQNFVVLPETLMTYRKHPRSVSSQQ